MELQLVLQWEELLELLQLVVQPELQLVLQQREQLVLALQQVLLHLR
jgi:hypothetical protein